MKKSGYLLARACTITHNYHRRYQACIGVRKLENAVPATTLGLICKIKLDHLRISPSLTLFPRMAEEMEKSISSADLPGNFMAEVETLRSIYCGAGELQVNREAATDCKDVIIQVSPSSCNYCLRLTLTGDYPLKAPRIEIHPTGAGKDELSDDSLQRILGTLYQTAQECIGEKMIFPLVEKFKHLLQQEDILSDENHSEECLPFPEGFTPDVSLEDEQRSKKKKVKVKKKRHLVVDSSLVNTKKPPMKTATDVIHRIMWDECLDQENFVVGYMDRFVGIIEKPFALFEWGDIAEADLLALAIPRHRIQHFKYKDVVVWDKTQRLDNVFGSTGNGIKIQDVIRKFEKENGHSEEKEICESNGSDDEDMSLEKLYEVGSSEDHSAEEDKEVVKGGKEAKKSQRPTHFIAVRVTAPDLVEEIQRLQAKICESDEMLKKACITAEKLHITLCVMRIEDREQVDLAGKVLKDLEHELASCFSPVTLFQFKKVECWQGRVVVSPVAGPGKDTLQKGVEVISAKLNEAGIKVKSDKRDFNPHLTAIKLKHWMRKKKKKYKIGDELIKPHEDLELGCQDVDEIHLCSMVDKPREDGFFHTIASVCTSLE